MNYTLTTLGLAICQPAVLQAKGVTGCPPNSRLGSGNAFVEVPFGTGSGHEIPEIQAVSGPPSPDGNMVVLFYANGQSPVSAQLVFQGEVLPDSGAFGSQLATTVPLVTSVPGGPDVSIVNVNATIGPSGLTYYKHVHGTPAAVSPTRHRRARTLPARRVSVQRLVRLPGRLADERLDDRSLPATGAAAQAQVAVALSPATPRPEALRWPDSRATRRPAPRRASPARGS